MANRLMRRALLYGINRPQILASEIMGGRSIPGCRVVSGPFPAPVSDTDAMAYAYDERLPPLPYDPSLGMLLTLMAKRELAEQAKNRNQPAPEVKQLVIAHPANEIPRVACGAIVAHLKRIGLEIILKELPPGITYDSSQDWDLLYVEAAIREPIVDAKRLLGEEGVAAPGSPYVRLALRGLDDAANWQDVYQQLQTLHRLIYDDVSVIPLWQTVDYLAYHARVKGIPDNPVTLYQNIEEWRMETPVAKARP